MDRKIQQLADRFEQVYGDRHWWPADNAFEIAIGAILTQNTTWRNVEKALANLKAQGRLTPINIAQIPIEHLQQLIQPAGYYRQKSQRLKKVTQWWLSYVGSEPTIDVSATWNIAQLRQSLLAVHGIGPETADSILLYAFQLPIFVVDTYTARIAYRLGLIDEGVSYDELQQLFTDALDCDIKFYNNLHAQIVWHGQHYCKKSKPQCETCCLRDICQGPKDLHT